MRTFASLRLAGLPLIIAFAAACGSTVATPTPPSTATPVSTAASATAVATDTPAAGATDTATPAAGTTATSAATATAAPGTRVARAWTHGQTVKQDVLVAPGVGWVRTTTGLWQTTNDGATWLDAYPHRLIASTIRGFTALDANHALLAAVDVGPATSTYYVWYTGDAGLTWRYAALPPIPHDVHSPGCVPGDFCGQPGDPPASLDFVDPSTAFASISMRQGIDGLQTYLFGTTNSGATWTARAFTPALLPIGPDPTERVQFQTATTGVVGAAYELDSTTTGWGHWSARLIADSWVYPTIYFVSSAYWVADEGLEYGTVAYHYAVSTNHGASWVDHTSSVPGLAGLDGAQVHFLSATEWIGTCQTGTGISHTPAPSTTIYTTDGGAHWAMYDHQPFNSSIASFIDSNHGWAGPSDPLVDGAALTTRVYTTSDRGLTWHLITP
jgi:hypothetical protein